MGMLVTITRSVPSVKEFLRFEGLMGRFVHLNLLPLSWCERMMQAEYDENNKIYAWLLQNVLNESPYKADLSLDTLFI